MPDERPHLRPITAHDKHGRHAVRLALRPRARERDPRPVGRPGNRFVDLARRVRQLARTPSGSVDDPDACVGRLDGARERDLSAVR